jgi:hypothetical protein
MIDLDVLREIYGERKRRYPEDKVAVIGAGPRGSPPLTTSLCSAIR